MSDPSTEVDPNRDDSDKMKSKYLAATERGLPSQKIGLEMPGAPDEADALQDILRVIPLNLEAKRALDSVVRLEKAGELSAIHAQFVQLTGSHPPPRSLKNPPRDTDETTDEPSSDDQSVINQPVTYEGYFRVRFRQSLVTQGLKWVCAT